MAAASGTQDIARRYATAFFALVQEQKSFDSVQKDMQVLQQVLEQGGLKNFLSNATLTRDEQGQGMAAVAAKLGLSDITRKLLGVLAQRRRLSVLSAVVGEIDLLLSAQKGEVTAHVTAAQALDQSQIDQLAASIKKTAGVQNVRVKLDINPEIIGGLIIRIGSQQMDSSVRSKLDRMARALKNPQNSSDKNTMKEVA